MDGTGVYTSPHKEPYDFPTFLRGYYKDAQIWSRELTKLRADLNAGGGSGGGGGTTEDPRFTTWVGTHINTPYEPGTQISQAKQNEWNQKTTLSFEGINQFSGAGANLWEYRDTASGGYHDDEGTGRKKVPALAVVHPGGTVVNYNGQTITVPSGSSNSKPGLRQWIEMLVVIMGALDVGRADTEFHTYYQNIRDNLNTDTYKSVFKRLSDLESSTGSGASVDWDMLTEDIVPATHLGIDIGANLKRIGHLYVNNATLGNNVTVGGTLSVAQTATFTGDTIGISYEDLDDKPTLPTAVDWDMLTESLIPAVGSTALTVGSNERPFRMFYTGDIRAGDDDDQLDIGRGETGQIVIGGAGRLATFSGNVRFVGTTSGISYNDLNDTPSGESGTAVDLDMLTENLAPATADTLTVGISARPFLSFYGNRIRSGSDSQQLNLGDDETGNVTIGSSTSTTQRFLVGCGARFARDVDFQGSTTGISYNDLEDLPLDPAGVDWDSLPESLIPAAGTSINIGRDVGRSFNEAFILQLQAGRDADFARQTLTIGGNRTADIAIANDIHPATAAANLGTGQIPWGIANISDLRSGADSRDLDIGTHRTQEVVMGRKDALNEPDIPITINGDLTVNGTTSGISYNDLDDTPSGGGGGITYTAVWRGAVPTSGTLTDRGLTASGAFFFGTWSAEALRSATGYTGVAMQVNFSDQTGDGQTFHHRLSGAISGTNIHGACGKWGQTGVVAYRFNLPNETWSVRNDAGGLANITLYLVS